MLNIVVSLVGFVGVISLPVDILLYTGFAPSPLMLMVKPEAEVTTPFLSNTVTPSYSEVIPDTVAVNAVAVEVLSHLPYGIAAVLLAAPPTVAEPAYLAVPTERAPEAA
jgi:hypothetical protein